jgi:hypothetical protein
MKEPMISDKISLLNTLLMGVSDRFNSDTPEACLPIAIIAAMLMGELMDLGQEMFTDDEVDMIDDARRFLVEVTDRLEGCK